MKQTIIIPWAEYHDLNAHARAIINPTAQQIEMYENDSYLNKIVMINNAKEVAQAFSDLCRAAWTPNQSMQDLERNARIIERCNKILDAI